MVGALAVKRAALLVLLLAGCSGQQTPLDPAGNQSQALAWLFELMVWVCGGAYLLVLLFLAASIFRARRKLNEAPQGEAQDDASLTRGLWLWGGLVTLGLVVLASASFVTDWALAQADRRADLEVRVTGHQWWWRIEYRDPASGAWIETANELHLPAGRTARVSLGSADVIHSFWVPNVAGKMDIVPGRRNVLSLSPRRAGWFRGQCAEFCGTQHALMAFDVKVESPELFAAWLARQGAPVAGADPQLARGRQIVTEGACASCHALRGTSASGRAGPDLTHLASRRMIAAGTLPMTRDAIQGWILQPRAVKPGTSMPPIPLTPKDADAASRYLVSLK
jgi:cytochrome c oxidase subunit 2